MAHWKANGQLSIRLNWTLWFWSYEAKCVQLGCFHRGSTSLHANFIWIRSSSNNHSWHQETRHRTTRWWRDCILLCSLPGLTPQATTRWGCLHTVIQETHTYRPISAFQVTPLYRPQDRRTLMDRKNTLVSAENDKNKEELHIWTALQNCGCPNWIFEKVKQDQWNKN